MEPAVTHARLVLDQRQHPHPLRVIPLGLTRYQRVAGEVAVRVEVLVALSRLPT